MTPHAMPGPPGPHIRVPAPLDGWYALPSEPTLWRAMRALGTLGLEEAQARLEELRGTTPFAGDLPEDADPEDKAQDLFYRGSACEDSIQQGLYMQEALTWSPEQVDPRTWRALRIDDPHERAQELGAIVASSEDALRETLASIRARGAEALDEHGVWHYIPARPFLRARAEHVRALIAAGRIPEAIRTCETLLELMPQDSLGARHVLASLLAEEGSWPALHALLDRFPDDDAIFFRWARVLAAQQDGGDAEALLAEAREANIHGERALLRPESWRPSAPRSYERGSKVEAGILSNLQWRAWHKRPEALAWLRERAKRPDLRHQPDEPIWKAFILEDAEGIRDGLLPFLDAEDPDLLAGLLAYVDAEIDPAFVYVGENALMLLHQLRLCERCVAQIVGFAARWVRTYDLDGSPALACIAQAGDAAVEPLLVAHDAAGDEEARRDLLHALVATGAHDARIVERIAAWLDDDLYWAASLLTDLGDPRGIPLISERLDVADPDPEAARASLVRDLVDMFLELGGEPTENQRERFGWAFEAHARHRTPEAEREILARMRAQVRALGAELSGEDDEDDDLFDDEGWAEESAAGLRLLPRGGGPGDGSLVAPDRPGRNEPCWCGSGKKYKRCHLAEDEAGDRS